MKNESSRPTGIVGAIAAVAFFGLCEFAHAQSTLSAHYVLTLADITIGEGDWTVEIAKDRYSAKSTGQFYGVWRVVLGNGISASTRGTAIQGHLAPTSYLANFAWEDSIKDVRMTFRDGAVGELEAKPPLPPAADRIAVTTAQLRGVVDPLTAGIVPMAATGDLLAPTACQRTVPIFDGSHRFDIALSFKRKDNVAADAGYRGPAVVCAMSYQPVAGYVPGTFQVDYLKKNHEMEMWFAPIPGTRMLGVFRISIPTMLGTAVLRATHFESTIR